MEVQVDKNELSEHNVGIWEAVNSGIIVLRMELQISISSVTVAQSTVISSQGPPL